MTSSRSWFSQGPMRQLLQPGNLVTLTHPQRTQWKINQIIKEHDNQMDQKDVRKDSPSYAALKLSCSKIGDPTAQAMMRVYLQIPYTNTELEDSTTRAQQATSFKPEELRTYQILGKDRWASKFTPSLLGYQESKQNDSGLVPGGFLTYIVWQIVPGLRLGDYSGDATRFWDSIKERAERDLIRALFQKTYLKLTRAGVLPQPCCASNLVWHTESKTLFWVGFRACIPCKPEHWRDSKLPAFDLVKDPLHERPMEPGWNGDTSRWQW